MRTTELQSCSESPHDDKFTVPGRAIDEAAASFRDGDVLPCELTAGLDLIYRVNGAPGTFYICGNVLVINDRLDPANCANLGSLLLAGQ